jgi:adenylate cyclase
MRVLIADDNADNRQLLTDIINSIGHEVLEAYDGDEAWEFAQSNLIDLVILDVNMPGLNGFEVCNRIKANAATADIPVLMLTAMGTAEHKVQGLTLGADDYLTKPFNPRELIERIKTRLRQKEQTDTLHRKQEMVRDTFERFVSPAVVEQLLKHPGQVTLGGKLQTITVLFADLEGFTRVAEKTEPDKLLGILNLYLTMMVGVAREKGGTIDKFIGDCMMALYSAPTPQPDHPQRAVETALAIRGLLPSLHDQLEPEFRVNINFGIHSGTAIVGNVGAPQIMNFTAIGDTVNLGFRLQELSHDGKILISSDTYAQLSDAYVAEAVGALTIRGRASAITGYEVLARRK